MVNRVDTDEERERKIKALQEELYKLNGDLANVRSRQTLRMVAEQTVKTARQLIALIDAEEP